MSKMRRLIVLFLCVASLYILTACADSEQERSDSEPERVDSEPEAIRFAEGEFFNLTPQEYIDYVNILVEDQEDSRYWLIPDYVESGKTIGIKNPYLTLKLTANDDGKLTEILWHWDATRQGTSDNTGLYLTATIYMCSPDTDVVQTVFDELDMSDTAPSQYGTSYTVDDVYYDYWTYGHGQYNQITITPVSND